jgi:hypothetical protein
LPPLDPQAEEELRNLVRRELEARERLHESGGAERRFRESVGQVSDERRRIIEDEIQSFYRARGHVRRWENDEGEFEWLTEEQIRERESQLPIDEEELEVGQQSMRIRVLVMSGLFLAGIVLLFFILRDRTGSIQVVSNIPGAAIVLDGSPTALVTDAILAKIPTGPHLISLAMEGYAADGPATMRVDVRPGIESVVTLRLTLSTLGTASPLSDSLKSILKGERRGR